MKKACHSARILLSLSLLFPVIVPAADEGPSQVLFQNVGIFNGTDEQLITGKDVLVEGNLIKSVGSGLAVAANVQVIDGQGLTLMPGIMDMHVHMSIYRPVGSMRDGLTALEVGALGAARMENPRGHLFE